MTTSTMNPTGTTSTCDSAIGTKIAFNDITQPGCYVCNFTGQLVRVNNDFDPTCAGSWWSWTGSEPMWFTCVSTDPNCSIDECRTFATENGINCCF